MISCQKESGEGPNAVHDIIRSARILFGTSETSGESSS